MANVNSLTIGNTTLPVANSLASLDDVSAPSPAAGQVLTYGDGGIWSPQAFQANGFPGLDELDWVDVEPIATPLKNPPVYIWPKIAKFQNMVFCKFGTPTENTILSGSLDSKYVKSFSIPAGYFNTSMTQAFLLDGLVFGKVEIGGDIWLASLTSSAERNLRGVAVWYV